MTTTEMTVADLKPGMFLHRVQQNYPSRVFEDAIDRLVLDVHPHPDYPEKTTVVLEPKAPATRQELNLDPTRTVYVTEA